MLRSRSSAGAAPRPRRYSRSPAGAFNPLAAIAWHSAFWTEDPDWSAPADGGAVSSWRNAGSVGTSYNLVQAAESKQPLFDADGLGGLPAVVGDGTDDFLATSAFTTVASPYTLVVVAALPGTGTRILTDGIAVGNRGALIYRDATPDWGTAYGVGGTPNSDAHLFANTVNGASSNLTVDGTPVATGTYSTGLTGLLAFSNFSGTGSFSAAKVGFIGLYAGVLPAADLAAIEAWVPRYGITVA